jgi:hypothetical protein
VAKAQTKARYKLESIRLPISGKDIEAVNSNRQCIKFPPITAIYLKLSRTRALQQNKNEKNEYLLFTLQGIRNQRNYSDYVKFVLSLLLSDSII